MTNFNSETECNSSYSLNGMNFFVFNYRTFFHEENHIYKILKNSHFLAYIFLAYTIVIG